MRDGRLNVLIVKPKKQVCCAPQLHQPALRADASGSQFSLFGPVMDTSAQIKQLPRRSRAAHHPAVMNKRRRCQGSYFINLRSAHMVEMHDWITVLRNAGRRHQHLRGRIQSAPKDPGGR